MIFETLHNVYLGKDRNTSFSFTVTFPILDKRVGMNKWLQDAKEIILTVICLKKICPSRNDMKQITFIINLKSNNSFDITKVRVLSL